MFLSNANQSLTITMSPAPVSAVSINIDYADHTARIPVAGNSSLQVTGTSSTLITGATSPNQRQIKNISIFNPNILPVEITIKQVYPPELIRKVATLQYNQTLQYTDYNGWDVLGTVSQNQAEPSLLDYLNDYYVSISGDTMTGTLNVPSISSTSYAGVSATQVSALSGATVVNVQNYLNSLNNSITGLNFDSSYVNVSGDTMTGGLYAPSVSNVSSITYYNNIQSLDSDPINSNEGITLSVKQYTTKLQKILATSFSGDAPYNFQTSFLSKNIFILLPSVASNNTQINYNRVTSGTISNTGGNLGLGLQGIMRFFRTTSLTNPGGGYLAHGSNTFLRGNSSSIGGGWMFSTKFTNFTNYSGQGSFVGMRRAPNITPISATLPSEDVCLFGLMSEVSGNMKIIHSDISGPASTIDLGSNFPYDSSTVYHFISYSEPNGSSIEYYVKNLNTGIETFGEVSQNIFDKETFVSNILYVRTTASNVSSAAVGAAHLYLETNY